MRPEPLTDTVFDKIERDLIERGYQVRFTPERQQVVRTAANYYHEFHHLKTLSNAKKQSDAQTKELLNLPMLKGIGEDAKRLAKKLEQVETVGGNNLLASHPLTPYVHFRSLLATLNTISSIADLIADKLKPPRGAPVKVEFRYLIHDLAEVFQDAGGEVKPGWHYASEDRYGGAFFRFVYEVLATCDGCKMEEGTLAKRLNSLLRR